MDAYNEQEVVTTEVVNEQAAAEVAKLANSAFGKCLAAVILAWWPVTSVIAIILGGIGLKAAKKATALAEANNISAGGKKVAAKITGMIGLIGGIVMTVFWLFYIIIIVAIIGAAAGF